MHKISSRVGFPIADVGDVDLRMRNTRTSLPNVLQGSVNKVGSGNTVMDDWRWNLLRTTNSGPSDGCSTRDAENCCASASLWTGPSPAQPNSMDKIHRPSTSLDHAMSLVAYSLAEPASLRWPRQALFLRVFVYCVE